jgi:hypothetical protein
MFAIAEALSRAFTNAVDIASDLYGACAEDYMLASQDPTYEPCPIRDLARQLADATLAQRQAQLDAFAGEEISHVAFCLRFGLDNPWLRRQDWRKTAEGCRAYTAQAEAILSA